MAKQDKNKTKGTVVTDTRTGVSPENHIISTNVFHPKPVLEGGNVINLPAHNMDYSGKLLLTKLDHHLAYKSTIIPIVNGDLTWEILAQCNESFLSLVKDVVELTNYRFSDDILNQIAKRVVEKVTTCHNVVEEESLEIVN